MAIVSKVASIIAKGVVGVGAVAAAFDVAKTLVDQQTKPTTGSNIYTDNNLTQFPYDLPKLNNQTYCMTFQFYQYSRPSILVAPTLIPYGMIALPLPTDMVDKSALSYSEVESTALVGAALENATVRSISGALQDFAQSAAGAEFDAANRLAESIGQAGTPAKILQMAGVAQNPFLSILFNAPTFKRHTFSWTFIPETQKDTENLNYILNKFRYHSLPDIGSSTGGLLLSYPDMCVPTLLPQGYMYDFKQCVVEGMSINYAPGNTPAFTTKNAPNTIRFTLSLLEIEYWVKSDLSTPNSGLNPLPGGLGGAGGFAPYGSGA